MVIQGLLRASTHGHEELLPACVAAAWWQLLPAWRHPGAASGLARGATSWPLPAWGSRSDWLAAEVCQWRKLPFPQAVGPGWSCSCCQGEQGAPPRWAKSPEQAQGALAPQGQDRARWELVLLPLALRSAPSLYMDFSRPCVRCAPAAEAQHSSCQCPQHHIHHPNSVIWPEYGMRLLGPGVACMGWGSLSARLQ